MWCELLNATYLKWSQMQQAIACLCRRLRFDSCSLMSRYQWSVRIETVCVWMGVEGERDRSRDEHRKENSRGDPGSHQPMCASFCQGSMLSKAHYMTGRGRYMSITHKESLHTSSPASIPTLSEPGRHWSTPVTPADANMPPGNRSTEMYWSEARNEN